MDKSISQFKEITKLTENEYLLLAYPNINNAKIKTGDFIKHCNDKLNLDRYATISQLQSGLNQLDAKINELINVLKIAGIVVNNITASTIFNSFTVIMNNIKI